MDELNNSRATFRLRMIGLFFLCALFMLLGWNVSSGYIETSEKIHTNKTLTSVGQLKVGQIQSYLADHKDDAFAVAGFLNSPSARHWLMHPDINAPAELNRLAESVVASHQYRELLLLDADANIRLGTGHGGTLGETGKSIALRMMRERIPVSHQIYFGDPAEPDVPVLDIFVPIVDVDGTKNIGVVVLRSELNFLFNLLQTWPAESETAESLLVTKDGSDVLFLNNLRHRKDTALKLRIPLSDDPNTPAWPSISAVTGRLGLFEANDYRGKHVLAYTIAVPDTPWSMVVKVDEGEVTARSHTLKIFTALALAIIFGLLGMILWTWWRKAETLHELQLMLDTSGEGFWKVDPSGHIIEVNDAYCHLIGYARDEIVGAHVSKFSLINPTTEVAAKHIQRVIEQGSERFATKHRHRDGHLIDIEVIASFIPETKCILSFLHDVTERKQTEALTQQFGRLLQNSFNEIYLFDATTLYFTQVSAGAKRNLGYSIDELKKLTPLDIKPLFTRESFEQMIAPLRSGERESLHFETVHRRKDGTIYPVEINLQLTAPTTTTTTTTTATTTTTTTTTFLVIVQDITERRQAEKTILESETKYRRLHESMMDAFVMVDMTGRLIDFNSAYQEMLGYSAEELQRLTCVDLTPQKWHGFESKIIGEQVLPSGQSEVYEKEYIRKDGTIFPVELKTFLLKDSSNRPEAMWAIVRDITERKRADNILRVAATAFETHEGITITDVEANIIRVNKAFENTTGYSQEEVLGSNPRFLHSGRQDARFYTEMWQQLLSAGTWSGEIWNKRKNGQIYPEWLTITAVKNGKGETTEYVGVFSDISLRKEAEEKLRKHNDELEAINRQLHDTQNLLMQSDKMASVGQLAAGVAHEINNPIGYVSSNLGTLDEYLKELLELVAACENIENVAADSAVLAQVKATRNKIDLNFLKEDIPALMSETHEGISRVRKIVQDLKDFSRADSGEEWQRADLHKGLDSTLNVASNEIKYKAEVRKEYGDIPEVECMISQLNQVFMNLLVNAAHAIEKHGLITIRTGQQDGEVWVQITDTGKGIAPEHLNKIFDPFFTTKPVGKGTGLGLSLSYGIIQKHHGRIEVSSELGKGTSFKVWLPVSQPQGL